MKNGTDRHCKVGVYEFNLVVNRNIALETFKRNPKYWQAIRKSEELSSAKNDISQLDNIENVAKILEINDETEEYVPSVVATALPMMLSEAGDKSNAKEIIEYCKENEVDDKFNNGIVEFLMLGFTNGKVEKNPKVEIEFN